jgi:uncharacterized protein (TIGR04255 family)
MTSEFHSPLGGAPPAEIPLANPPLDRVVAQVQFTPITKVDDRNFVAGFQEKLRAKYPFFEEGGEQALLFEAGPGGQSLSQRQRPVWRFFDAKRNWRISLTSEAISLDVKLYSSRDDFLERWDEILGVMAAEFKPSLVVRVGMRYIDRIRDENFPRVDKLIKIDYLGPLFTKFQNQVLHMLGETALSAEEGNLLLRLGKLPGGGTVDPNLLDAIQGESFIIDIDVSKLGQREFELESLKITFRQFAERAYAMFRDIVTAEFDATYGGKK